MKNKIAQIFTALVLSLLLSSLNAQDLNTRIADLLAEMPAANLEKSDQLMEKFVATGSEGFAMVSRLLQAPGQGDDTPARYAINTLAIYSSGPGKEAAREFAETNLLKTLQNTENEEIRSFLLDQLYFVATERSIDPVTRFLGSARLSDHASRTMLAIGGKKVINAMVAELKNSQGSANVNIIQALGTLQADESLDILASLASSDNQTIKRACLSALAVIGNPASYKILEKAVTQSKFEYGLQDDAGNFLLYANRLGERGEYKLCRKACLFMIKSNSEPQFAHNYASALYIYTKYFPGKAFPLLLKTSLKEDAKLRAAALDLAINQGGEKETRIWMAVAKKSDPEIKADIIYMLGLRKDPLAREFITGNINHGSEAVRLESMTALASLDPESAKNELIRHLISGRDVEPTQRILMQLVKKEDLNLLSPGLNNTSGKTRAAFVNLIASRGGEEYFNEIFPITTSADTDEKTAAFQALSTITPIDKTDKLLKLLNEVTETSEINALQAALLKMARDPDNREIIAEKVRKGFHSTAKKERFLEILPAFGGEEELATLTSIYKSSSGELKNAATNALIEWPELSAADVLIEIYQTGDEDARAGALSSYLKLVQAARISDDQKQAYLLKMMEITGTTKEKERIIVAMSNVRTLPALKYLDSCLQNKSLEQSACRAIINLAISDENTAGVFPRTYLRDLLTRVETIISGRESEYLKVKVRDFLDKTPGYEEEGFVSLFNGINLDGWLGNKTGYEVANGIIVYDPGKEGKGNLYTEKEYADFIFRFEFRLTPGANNGLGIRAPLTGDAAYVGMELQILDNTAPIYADLKPYQYHGSVYGIIPAKRGYLKPLGEWNSQEVIARGTRITVILNGETILDGDIREATRNGNMDGREHPGLFNEKGYIGFLKHGTMVSFRNIWIKELDREYAP